MLLFVLNGLQHIWDDCPQLTNMFFRGLNQPETMEELWVCIIYTWMQLMIFCVNLLAWNQLLGCFGVLLGSVIKPPGLWRIMCAQVEPQFCSPHVSWRCTAPQNGRLQRSGSKAPLCSGMEVFVCVSWLAQHIDVENPAFVDDLSTKIRPHRRCKGRDHPDGISQLRFRFTWGGGGPLFGKNLLFLIGRDARLHKTL